MRTNPNAGNSQRPPPGGPKEGCRDQEVGRPHDTPGATPASADALVAHSTVLADTTITKVTSGGAFTSGGQTAVGFNPNLALPDLVINGQKATAHVINALTSATLTRSITGASTLELVVADPDRLLVRSQIAQISAPSEPLMSTLVTVTATPNPKPTQAAGSTQPIQIRPGMGGLAAAVAAAQNPVDALVYTTTSRTVLRLSKDKYYPTTVSITDGTTSLTFAWAETQGPRLFGIWAGVTERERRAGRQGVTATGRQ